MTCSHIFADSSTEYLVNDLPSKTPMNIKVEDAPEAKGNVVLIHGLGDDLTSLNLLAARLKQQGYNILRMDLHGRGKSLMKPVPKIISYVDNARDITELIKRLDYKNPIIIGHSYGGAIAYSVSNRLTGKYRASKLIMLAPYLRRLDHLMFTGNPILDMQAEIISEQFARQRYYSYFKEKNADDIDTQVDSAVASVKGIRSFDVLSYDKKASPSHKQPLLVIGGLRDDLVTPDQIQEFHDKLFKENYTHKIEYIDSDHHFPQNASKPTIGLILDFIQQ